MFKSYKRLSRDSEREWEMEKSEGKGSGWCLTFLASPLISSSYFHSFASSPPRFSLSLTDEQMSSARCVFPLSCFSLLPQR